MRTANSDGVAWAFRDDVARVRRLAGMCIFGAGQASVKRARLRLVASTSAGWNDGGQFVEVEFDDRL